MREPGAAAVFETRMTFRPGPFEIIAVAHETSRDEITAARFEGSWPDPTVGGSIVGPIALLQPTHAAFLREGQLRNRGSMGLRAGEPIRTDLPTALVGIVCHDRRKTGRPVERRLVGESTAEFPALDLSAAEERCAVFSDVIPAGTLTPGRFVYEVKVPGGDTAIGAGREFAAVAPKGAL